MREKIKEILNANHPGLHILEITTGYGKTYLTSMETADFVKNHTEKKVVYLTSLTKNVDDFEDALKNSYGNDYKGFRKDVLRIESNFENIVKHLCEIPVPEAYRNGNYDELIKYVDKYIRAKKEKYRDLEYVDDLKEKIEKQERLYRKFISSQLSRQFHTKSEMLEGIHKNKEYKWIGELYPAVFTDEKKILLLTVSKWLRKNATLVDFPYDFLDAHFIENSIIIIDEFDASKATMQDSIIQNALQNRNEYITLFRHLHTAINPDNFSIFLKKSAERAKKKSRYNIQNLMDESEQLMMDYKLFLRYKSVEDIVDTSSNFLLKDASFHTILKKGAQYISTRENHELNRIDISYDDKETFYQNQKEDDIVIYGMLRAIGAYLEHFRKFMYSWGNEYMILHNENSNEIDMSLENAITSILTSLDISEKEQKLLLSELCGSKIKVQKERILPDISFYEKGFELFGLEDNINHKDFTSFNFLKVYDTPEKILIDMSKKATVLGISATASIPTVIGNYNLSYVANKLGSDYHPMDVELVNNIREELDKQWKAYDEGKVKVHVKKLVLENAKNINLEKKCLLIMNESEYGMIIATKIETLAADPYSWSRYMNILQVMKEFTLNRNVQSFLYLGMALPKDNNPNMDKQLLEDFLDMCCEMNGVEKVSLVVLGSDNFDEQKENLISRLTAGEKIFIMSTYKTLGAGQNLQYPVSDKGKYVELIPSENISDKRHSYKDIDAIYLGDITHLTINTYGEEQFSDDKLLEMIFQIEELYHNGELSHCDMENMIKLAFRKRNGSKQYVNNILYGLDSIRMQATQQVIQAVGRMCRTFLKNPDIYIYIDDLLLEKIDANEINKRVIPPELKAIVQLSRSLGKTYTKEENRLLYLAERISSHGMWRIRQMLSKNWTDISMALWQSLREITLKYPTAQSAEYEHEELVNELYISSGRKSNTYLYSQFSDFNDVTIDFGVDKVGFANSGRAKIRGAGEDVVVYEMSEENSGLPAMLKYQGIREYFHEKGYSTKFVEAEYLMSPVLYHNVYKGALGEVVGRYILEKERGIHLSEITEPDIFEFFDFKMADDVYVDFKNWKFSYVQDRRKTLTEIEYKMNQIGAKRVYVINVSGNRDFVPTACNHGKIIEIPRLIDENGKIVPEALDMIYEEDY